MRVNCPSCGAENTAEQAGQQVVCNSCFEIFDAPGQASSPAPERRPVPSAPPVNPDPFAAAPQNPVRSTEPVNTEPLAAPARAPSADANEGPTRSRSSRVERQLQKGDRRSLKTMHERSTGGYRKRGDQSSSAENVFSEGEAPKRNATVEQRPRYSRAPLGDTSPNSSDGRSDRGAQRRPASSRPDSRSASGQRPAEKAPADDPFATQSTPAPRRDARVRSSSRPMPPPAADSFTAPPSAEDPFSIDSPSSSQSADPFSTGADDPLASSNPFSSPPPASEADPFASPLDKPSEADPFGAVGGTAPSGNSNPFGGTEESSSDKADDPFGEKEWNPFGGDEGAQEEADPFGGSGLFEDEVATETQNLLSDGTTDDAEEEPMVLDVSGLSLADEVDDGVAGEALFELDLPEPDDERPAPQRRRRRKGKVKKKRGKGKSGSKASKAARRKQAKKQQRQRLMFILLLVIGLGAGMHFTEMGAFGINILMPEETKSTPSRIPRRSKSKLQELRSAKADGPEDHIERIKELKDEWKKNQKNKVIVADLAAALVGFEERYPGVYASQQKLVGKVAKAVIKPVTFKEHQLGVRKLIIDKKYPEALKTLKAVMDAPEYDVKADDNYLRARIARLTNDNRNAIKYYMKVINEVPNYEAAAYDLAQIYLDLKQYAKAQELFLELRKNMKHSGSRLGMGIVDLSMKKASEDVSSETEINLNDALAISRKVGDKKMQFQIHRVRADLYRRQGKTDQQLADLQLVLGLKPGNEESAIALAEIYQKKGQGPDTLKTLKTCKKNGCKSAKFIAFYVTKLYEVEQPREAGAELNSGLELYPKDPQLLELKAEKAYQAKNLLNAIQLYEKLKEFHPTYEPSYLKLAKLLDEDGKSDQAVRVLEQGIERVHDKMSLMEKAARFHAKKGNNQKAKEYFEQILKEDPGRADLKLRFAILLKELGNDKDAYKYFKELAETNSLSPKQEITYAEVLHKLGKLKEATEVLDCEGKSLDKKRSAASEIRCGVLRTTSGDYEKADAHLSKALALESSDRAYYYIGMNELARRSYSLAAQNLKRAVFLNKKALDAKVGLARALRHLGGTDNLQKAMIHLAGVIDTYSRYRTPLEMNSRDPEAYLQRGVLYLQAKEEQRAIADFDQGLSLDPNHADLTVAKAKALYYARQTKVATELLKKLIKREPKHAGAHFYLGRMYNATGLTVRSATHFSKCLKYADKTFAQVHEAHQSLANLYKEMKQNSKACEHMKQYLRTAPDNVSDRFDVADEVRKNCVR